MSCCAPSNNIVIIRSGDDLPAALDDTLDGTPIVFLAGHKGITLRHKDTGKPGWFQWYQAAGLSTPDLRVPLDGKMDDWVPGEPLQRVAHVSVYSRCFKWLNEYARSRKSLVISWTYDWRLDLSDNIPPFLKFMEDLYKRMGKPISVLAHSLAGLWSFVAMKEQPKLLHSMCFVGVPFGCGIGFLKDLHYGHGTLSGYNHDIMCSQVHWTLPSSYQIGFPLKEEGGGNPPYLQTNLGDAIDMDFFNIEDWKAMKFGPFSYSKFELTSEWEEHLNRCLLSAKNFRKRLIDRSEGFEYPPISIVAGRGKPTMVSMVRLDDGSWSFDNAKKDTTGDGRVGPIECSQLHPSIPYTTFYSNFDHWKLMQDLVVVEHAMNCLL